MRGGGTALHGGGGARPASGLLLRTTYASHVHVNSVCNPKRAAVVKSVSYTGCST